MAKKVDLDRLGEFKALENAMVAGAYSASKTYAVGDYVYYKGTLYKCTTAITTAEAWTSGHWTAAKLAEDVAAQSAKIGDLKNDFNQYRDNVAISNQNYNACVYVNTNADASYQSHYRIDLPSIGSAKYIGVGMNATLASFVKSKLLRLTYTFETDYSSDKISVSVLKGGNIDMTAEMSDGTVTAIIKVPDSIASGSYAYVVVYADATSTAGYVEITSYNVEELTAVTTQDVKKLETEENSTFEDVTSYAVIGENFSTNGYATRTGNLVEFEELNSGGYGYFGVLVNNAAKIDALRGKVVKFSLEYDIDDEVKNWLAPVARYSNGTPDVLYQSYDGSRLEWTIRVPVSGTLTYFGISLSNYILPNKIYSVDEGSTIELTGYKVYVIEDINSRFYSVEENLIVASMTNNLIDPSKIESNTYYRASDGEKLGGSNYLSSTGLIPVTEGKTYSINRLGSSQPHWTCWKGDGTFVTGDSASAYSYTIPTGYDIKYLRVSIKMSEETTAMIVESPVADYSNYFEFGHPARYPRTQWHGKKAAMLGDSLTQQGKWESMFSNILGLAEYNVYAQYGGNMTAIANFVSQIDSDTDLLTVWAGTNDFANGITLGDFGSTDVNEYSGALYSIINYCGTNLPNMKLLLITPMQRFDTVVSEWERDENLAYINPNTGKTLEDYANMVIKYGQVYGIPVLDMYHTSGVNEYNQAAYTYDGLHPDENGFARLCWHIINAAIGM